MIEITYSENKDEFWIAAEGHADYGPHGSDIVCSASSILWETLEAAVEERCDSFHIDHGVTVWAFGPEAMSIFRTIFLGYRLLASNYPENVRITEAGGCPIQ